MEDWRGRGSGRPDPGVLRIHCQYFSRLGWALFALMMSMLAVQVLAGVPVGILAPWLLGEPVFLWALSVLSVYGVGLPAFCLVLRGTASARPAQARPLGLARFLQVYVICLCAMYLANYFTLTLTELIGLLRGKAVSNPVEQMEAYPELLNLLLGCVIAPVSEELMFRRLLLDRLRPYGDKFAVLASALCFGLFHGNLNQLFYAVAIGLVLGYVALRTGRIWQSTLLHAMLNFISVGLLPLLEPLGDTGMNLLAALVLGAIVLGLVFFITLRRELRFAPGTVSLSGGWTWRLFFENPGVLCFCLLSLALCASYLL
ncbi:CPBP family intramembrane glutamic endopeptidase [uncultured Flavonifractor sp.]|uniref:CPBP family intramembrane glutamic endopeptidase n=1 Tax=uncultured Flavonifractor sp. TaxID=1193534 RepID=UPI00261E5E13|nr:type II CAAX endopeptidase family protein [uncultured Flavonifractor sp.]